jgi:hypothetical protein
MAAVLIAFHPVESAEPTAETSELTRLFTPAHHVEKKLEIAFHAVVVAVFAAFHAVVSAVVMAVHVAALAVLIAFHALIRYAFTVSQF